MNWLQRFMAGRYGTDHFSLTLLVFSLILSLFLQLFGLGWLAILTYIPICIACFRTFSRNTSKRWEENQKFLRAVSPFLSWLRKQQTHWQQKKTHCFFRCPKCRQTLRVPKGRGKIIITCPKCKKEFTRKT